MRVRLGSVYTYRPVGIDRFDAKTNLQDGEKVRVVHPQGCPPPNTMGHAHVARLDGKFCGLVHCNSLVKE